MSGRLHTRSIHIQKSLCCRFGVDSLRTTCQLFLGAIVNVKLRSEFGLVSLYLSTYPKHQTVAIMRQTAVSASTHIYVPVCACNCTREIVCRIVQHIYPPSNFTIIKCVRFMALFGRSLCVGNLPHLKPHIHTHVLLQVHPHWAVG